MFWKKNIFFINFLWAASELSAPTVEVKKVNDQATHLIRYDCFLYDGLSSCLSPQWSGLSRVQSTFNIPEDLSPPPRTDCGVSRPLVSQRRYDGVHYGATTMQHRCMQWTCNGNALVAAWDRSPASEDFRSSTLPPMVLEWDLEHPHLGVHIHSVMCRTHRQMHIRHKTWM